MDVGNGGGEHWGCVLHCLNAWAKCSFSCKLVALLENFEGAKIDIEMHVSSDVKNSKLQHFLGKHAPRLP